MSEAKFNVGDRVQQTWGAAGDPYGHDFGVITAQESSGVWCYTTDGGRKARDAAEDLRLVDAAAKPTAADAPPPLTTCGDCDLQYVAATCIIGRCPSCAAVDSYRQFVAANASLRRAADEARRNSGVAKLESPFSPRKIRGDGW